MNSTLFIHVRGGQQPLQVRMSKPEMIVGRDAPDSLTVPDIDLSTYNGKEMGVSRIHARLRFQDNTLTLTDLGSINHTFVNGQRLHAHEVRVLRDGDEIRLGRLVIRIAFQHELRRLR